MPVVRGLRRSRRLSKQQPLDGWEWEGAELLYPTSETFSPSSPQLCLASPADSILDGPSIPSPGPAINNSTQSSPSPFCFKGSSHARRRKEGHIPRPPNAFMLFRSDFWRKRKVTDSIESDHRHISRIAGFCWNGMTDEERAPYKLLAEQAKQAHAAQYPHYKYSPQYPKAKPPKRRVKRDGEKDAARCKKMASLVIQGIQGRDLEDALRRMEQDGDDSVRVKTPSSSKPPSSSKLPSSSKPPSRRLVPKYQPSPLIKDQLFKEEIPSTPELTFSSPVFSSPVFSSPVFSSSVFPSPVFSSPGSSSSVYHDDSDEFVMTEKFASLELSGKTAQKVEMKEKESPMSAQYTNDPYLGSYVLEPTPESTPPSFDMGNTSTSYNGAFDSEGYLNGYTHCEEVDYSLFENPSPFDSGTQFMEWIDFDNISPV